MEKWREVAIAEARSLVALLHQLDFTAADMGDRLRGLLEYIELEPDKDPINEDCKP